MKVGLLTFHNTNNFGSYLQTYGLYKTVIDMGYDCEIIDYQCEAIVKRENIEKRKLSLNIRGILKDIIVNRVLRKKYKNLFNWLRLHSKISQNYSKASIMTSCLNYDRILVGSDIVWGMDIIEGDTTYFLDFCNDKNKKLAFASSVGNPWSESDKYIIKPLLKDFNKIAVREDESAQWVEELTNERPSTVCDPTMLLPSEEWKSLCSDKYKDKKYVLIYFPTAECLKAAKAFAQAYGIPCYVINYGLPIKDVKSIRPITIYDFLSAFLNASFVCTASYHGMLFSIYFNRQFAFFNRAHKSRMINIARKLEVSDRDGSRYDVLKMQPINYIKVNSAVDAFRNYSVNYLKDMLANA